MNYLESPKLSNIHIPRWWRGIVIVLATLIMCSCRWPHRATNVVETSDCNCPPAVAMADSHGTAPHGMLPGPAYYPSDQQWKPPGIRGPWPQDEYIHDGGDRRPAVRVSEDWNIVGLELEDTVAHYDTVDGRVVVEPSNKVCIYAPRFGAVRQVSSMNQYDQIAAVAATEVNQPFIQKNILTKVAANHQPLAAGTNLTTLRQTIFLTRGAGLDVTNADSAAGLHNGFLPFENLAIIRRGIFIGSEKGALAVRVDAAASWATNIGLQATIKNQPASEAVGNRKSQVTFSFEQFPGDAKLRVIKIASKKDALSGEIIDFTIRFDNVGEQPIGNVTLLDNLTTRLEFVRKSDQSTVKSNFSFKENEGGSVLLRWELEKPLKAGEGGIVRFKCRVR